MRISDWSSDVCSSDLGSAACATVMTIILQGFRGPDKKFDISFRAFYRTFDKSVDDPAATLLQPLGHLFANTPMNSRIAHHATLAHFIRARLELWFDKREQTPPRPEIGRAAGRERGGQYV